VDDATEEGLVSLVGKEVEEVVHLVDGLEVGSILLAPLGEKLLSNQVDQVLDVLVVGQVLVLLGVLEANLNLVHEGPDH